MSLAALDRLEAAHEELISALDANDIDGIERRLEQLRAATMAVRSAGGWRDIPQVREQALRIAQLGEAARVRVNFLTDRTRHRLQMLASVRGDVTSTAYRRPRRHQAV